MAHSRAIKSKILEFFKPPTTSKNITVYVDVPFSAALDSQVKTREGIIYFEKKETVELFAEALDLKKMVDAINYYKFKQVDLTLKNACKIAGQHGFHYARLIVALNIPRSYLSKEEYSEADIFPNQLNAGEEKFFILEKKIMEEHIISIQLMPVEFYYFNTLKNKEVWRVLEENIWPSNFKYIRKIHPNNEQENEDESSSAKEEMKCNNNNENKLIYK